MIVAAKAEGKDYSLITIGKKAEGYFKFRNYTIDAAFTGISDKPTYEDAREVAAKVTELAVKRFQAEVLYTREQYDVVLL